LSGCQGGHGWDEPPRAGSRGRFRGAAPRRGPSSDHPSPEGGLAPISGPAPGDRPCLLGMPVGPVLAGTKGGPWLPPSAGPQRGPEPPPLPVGARLRPPPQNPTVKAFCGATARQPALHRAPPDLGMEGASQGGPPAPQVEKGPPRVTGQLPPDPELARPQ